MTDPNKIEVEFNYDEVTLQQVLDAIQISLDHQKLVIDFLQRITLIQQEKTMKMQRKE